LHEKKIKNEIIYFPIIDKGGLYETNVIDVDINQKKDILKLTCKENKNNGILFLSHYQDERFNFYDKKYIFKDEDFWIRISK